MKHFIYLFLYLNIYTAVFYTLKAQVITLALEAEKPISQNLQDSLQFKKEFSDLNTAVSHVDSLSARLQRLGYIDNELLLFEQKNDTTLVANFYFGRKYPLIKIYYSEENFSKKEISKISSEITDTYFTLPFETIERSLQKLNSSKTEKGNAFAKLQLKEITKEEDGTLSATLFLDKGTIRTIDSIVIKGYEKFPVSFLKYVAGVKKGNVFSRKKLLSQNDAINNLSFTSTIKPPEALFRKDSTVVYFYLQKKNANVFDGILGFATNEETNKLEFNGYLNLELNNNLNFGEQLLINYKADGEDQRNFRVRTTLPYLFKSPFGIALELKIFKQDSTYITTDQQARVLYQINPSSSSYIGYKAYESSNLLDEQIVGSPVEDYSSKFITAGVYYRKSQNSLLFPIKSEINLETEIGKRDVKAASDNQIRLLSTVNHIFNLNYKNSVFLQNTTNILFSDLYLINELFRFGGINSIRGFDENSIDASFFSILNTEYRYQFNGGLFINSIVDLGYFENKTIALKQKLYSYGIGLGLQTKAGLLKLNIANGNAENQSFKFSNSKIHLSISSKF